MPQDDHDTTLRLSAMDFALKALSHSQTTIAAAEVVDFAEAVYAFLKDTQPLGKVDNGDDIPF